MVLHVLHVAQAQEVTRHVDLCQVGLVGSRGSGLVAALHIDVDVDVREVFIAAGAARGVVATTGFWCFATTGFWRFAAALQAGQVDAQRFAELVENLVDDLVDQLALPLALQTRLAEIAGAFVTFAGLLVEHRETVVTVLRDAALVAVVQRAGLVRGVVADALGAVGGVASADGGHVRFL